MKIFIGNPTKQTRVFQYKLPNQFREVTVPIPPGQVVQINHDFDPRVWEPIKTHHEMYGMIRVGQYPDENLITPLVYQEDRPIEPKYLQSLMENNESILKGLGSTIRRENVTAMADTFSKAPGFAGDFELKIIEQNAPPTRDAGEEHYRLDTQAPVQTAPRGRGRRSRG